MSTITHIDMHKFCEEIDAQTHHRYSLKSPWFEDGWIYATDGAKLARLKADSGPEPSGKTPNVKKLFKLTPFPKRGWVALPELTYGVFRYGSVPKKCRWCRGKGERECDMGHKHVCDKCNGTKKVDDPNEFYRKLLVPFWDVAEEMVLGKSDGNLCLLFRAPGFEGIAMGTSDGDYA